MNPAIKSLPLVTIVTVVYNGEDFIERTILSVTSQTYQLIEYIIIDGGSTDRTVDIIKRHESKIHYWKSEKDAGIYDAMNKGIDIASGEWINFMNAGDTFSKNSTVDDIFSEDRNGSTILYGDVNIIYPTFSRLAKAKSVRSIPKGMPFCHQSSFVKTDYHRIHRFNIQNRIVADMEFFMSAYGANVPFEYLSVTVSNVIVGGLSDANRLNTILAWYRTSIALGSSRRVAWHFMFLIIDCIARGAIKKLLPRSTIDHFIQNK
jgi:glycosyltransferase involved in cell wall biosynthesis